MKHTSITINGNQLTSKILLTNEQSFFTDKFIWNKLTTVGKDQVPGVNTKSFGFSGDKEIKVETRTEEQTATEAFDEHVQYAQQVSNEISNHLKKFQNQRDQWEQALLMTLNACGLCEEEEGGES